MWSRYNSRQVPKVIGYRQLDVGRYEWTVLKERETTAQVIAFWK